MAPDPSADPALRRQSLSRRQVRIALYLALILSDVAAIRAGFSMGVSTRGAYWMSPNGVELGWILVPIYLLLALRGRALGADAVASRLEGCRRATAAFLLAAGLLCMLMFFQAAGHLVSRLGLGVAMGFSLVFIVLFRTVFLTLFVSRKEQRLYGELLILDGTAPPPGFNGVLLDARAENLRPDSHDFAQLERLAAQVRVYDRVVVATHDDDQRSRWAQVLKAFSVTGEVLLDEGGPLGAIGVGRFMGHDTVIVSRLPLSITNRMKKRLMDIVLSLAFLILIAPLMIVVAIAIKLDSRGPVLFAQPRVGRNNQLFNILKFRSMYVERSDHRGDRSTSRDDDRITRVGRFIRKTSIDELPQLLNVLKGDMSIVGPRPHALGSRAGEKLFWQVDEGYWQRHQLKPGITGLAQVRGFRGSTSQESDLSNRLQADLEYISGWSLGRDIRILLMTLRVVVHPHAY